MQSCGSGGQHNRVVQALERSVREPKRSSVIPSRQSLFSPVLSHRSEWARPGYGGVRGKGRCLSPPTLDQRRPEGKDAQAIARRRMPSSVSASSGDPLGRLMFTRVPKRHERDPQPAMATLSSDDRVMSEEVGTVSHRVGRQRLRTNRSPKWPSDHRADCPHRPPEPVPRSASASNCATGGWLRTPSPRVELAAHRVTE
jgi:hypothetical protein